VLATSQFINPSYRLLSRNVKTKIYVTIILPVVLYGVKLGLSHKGKNIDMRVFQNRALGRIFGRKRDGIV
jgi:hypothetical protein